MPDKRGRPTSLTPELAAKLEQILTAGNYIEPACLMVGIDDSTFYKWMKLGKKETTGIYFDFFHAISRSMALSEVGAVAVWKKATQDDWKAAAEFLRSRYPDRWGRTRQEITGKDGGSIDLTIRPGAVSRIRELFRPGIDSGPAPSLGDGSEDTD